MECSMNTGVRADIGMSDLQATAWAVASNYLRLGRLGYGLGRSIPTYGSHEYIINYCF